MTLTRTIVTNFIEHYISLHIHDEPLPSGEEAARPRPKPRKSRSKDDEQSLSRLRYDKHGREYVIRVTSSLVELSDQFDCFVAQTDELRKRFDELHTPLIPILTGSPDPENQQQFTNAFRAIADELFSPDISWERIVTFLVYSAKLGVTVTKQAEGDAKALRITQIINNVSTYIEEKIMQWIDQQDGGWLNVAKNEDFCMSTTDMLSFNGSHSTNGIGNSNDRYKRGVVVLAAFVALFGGLYMFKKFSER